MEKGPIQRVYIDTCSEDTLYYTRYLSPIANASHM